MPPADDPRPAGRVCDGPPARSGPPEQSGPPIDLATVYDGFAATYDADRDLFDLTEVLASFLAGLPERGHLLDLGCGAGIPVASTFVERGWSVTGVDVSRGMLDLAADHVPQMTTVCADMTQVEFAQGAFQAITAVYSLFHVPRAAHPALFTRIRGWLAPGGRLLFTYATSDYTGEERFDGLKEFMGQQLYYSHTSEAELRSQLQAAGLVVDSWRVREIGGESFLWVEASRPEWQADQTPEPGDA